MITSCFTLASLIDLLLFIYRRGIRKGILSIAISTPSHPLGTVIARWFSGVHSDARSIEQHEC